MSARASRIKNTDSAVSDTVNNPVSSMSVGSSDITSAHIASNEEVDNENLHGEQSAQIMLSQQFDKNRDNADSITKNAEHRILHPIPVLDSISYSSHDRAKTLPLPRGLQSTLSNEFASFDGNQLFIPTHCPAYSLESPTTMFLRHPKWAGRSFPSSNRQSSSNWQPPYSQWQIMLYRDRNIVVYDPCKNIMGSKVISPEEDSAIANYLMTSCPMCGQAVNPVTFSFESQIYFRMLQRLTSTFCAAPTMSSRSSEDPGLTTTSGTFGDRTDVIEEIFPWSSPRPISQPASLLRTASLPLSSYDHGSPPSSKWNEEGSLGTHPPSLHGPAVTRVPGRSLPTKSNASRLSRTPSPLLSIPKYAPSVATPTLPSLHGGVLSPPFSRKHPRGSFLMNTAPTGPDTLVAAKSSPSPKTDPAISLPLTLSVTANTFSPSISHRPNIPSFVEDSDEGSSCYEVQDLPRISRTWKERPRAISFHESSVPMSDSVSQVVSFSPKTFAVAPPFSADQSEKIENSFKDNTVMTRKWLFQESCIAPSSPLSNANPFIRSPAVLGKLFVHEEEGESIPIPLNIPTELLVTGYYKRFFVELKKLGSGSHGQVYLCTHVLDNLTLGEYAVKKMAVGDNKTWFRKMIREVKIRENIRHRNIVDYKHSWMEMHRSNVLCPWVPWLFVLMEYCNGGTLETLIWNDSVNFSSNKTVTYLSDCQIWKILFDVLYGLQHLHHSGILHRDMKTSNILLNYTVEPYTRKKNITALLSDFGTAEILWDYTHRMDRHGFTGTVEYTAPELLEMDEEGHFREDYDTKSDMWSLGIVLYALCYGKLPYSHNDPQICRNLILEHSRIKLPDFPQRSSLLRHLLVALTSLNPQERPSTDEILANRSVRLILFDANYLEAASEEFFLMRIT